MAAPPLSPIPLRPAGSQLSRVELGVSAFNALLEVPTVNKATFTNKSTINLELSSKSLATLSKTSSTQSIILAHDGTPLATTPLTFSSKEVAHTSLSPDGTRSAVFRVVDAKDGAKKRTIIEVWDLVTALKEAEVEVTAKHGDCYFDDTFGPPSWSPDGLALVYTAESLPETAPPAPGQLPTKASFVYTADYGERFTGKKFPSLFLLLLPASPWYIPPLTPTGSVKKATVHQLTDPLAFPELGFGQPIFVPSPPTAATVPRILCTGYAPTGDAKKLGIVYCANRPARIYELEFERGPARRKAQETNEPPHIEWQAVNAVAQSPADRSARSPRVFVPPPGVKLAPLVVFLSNPVGGPHSSCASLHAVSLASGNFVTLVENVAAPKTSEDFPGLYLDQLPQKPFVLTPSGPSVVLTSAWRSRRVALSISLKTGAVTSLTPWPKPDVDDPLPYLRSDLSSISVLGTDGGKQIIASRSSMSSPAELILGEVDASGNVSEWKVIRKTSVPKFVEDELAKLDSTVLPLKGFEPSELLLLSPIKIDQAAESTRSLPPLITIPHGGPHSASSTDFNAQVAFLAVAGYRVALVNYPGSIGFGQDFVDALPGPQLGTLEVEATLAAGHYLNQLSLASRAKGSRLLMGGSHGGWTGCHLTSKFPDEFDAVVLRNPVSDLNGQLSASDIPDWAMTEAGLPYDLESPPTLAYSVETYKRLYDVSPLKLARDVITPTLLLVGADDRRVPPDQARAWFHELKNSGKAEVEMLKFKDNWHGIVETVEAEIVTFEAGLKWLERFTVW